jgi:hypothetical protein
MLKSNQFTTGQIIALYLYCVLAHTAEFDKDSREEFQVSTGKMITTTRKVFRFERFWLEDDMLSGIHVGFSLMENEAALTASCIVFQGEDYNHVITRLMTRHTWRSRSRRYSQRLLCLHLFEDHQLIL